MKYIIWGTGSYCKEKLGGFKKEEIIAFADRSKFSFCGRETILPEEILEYEFDFIVVLSNYYLEIIPDILALGIAPEKIIPGIVRKPYLFSELEYISAQIKIDVKEDGSISYLFPDGERITVSNKKDMELVKSRICREENVEKIQRLELQPVGKLYGGNRGGSIVRYFISQFLEKEKSYIKGDVLEIGDRHYTELYGAENVKSYVLHFEEGCYLEPYDFFGNLMTGTGLKQDFYDCIILTQVLNFVEDITHTADYLINALKPGGKLLLSVSGISAICRYEMERYGQYWNFTDKSIRNMFSKKNTKCDVFIRGNCKVACAFLQGMSCRELEKSELEYTDEDFQVIILAEITKC